MTSSQPPQDEKAPHIFFLSTIIYYCAAICVFLPRWYAHVTAIDMTKPNADILTFFYVLIGVIIIFAPMLYYFFCDIFFKKRTAKTTNQTSETWPDAKY